MIYLDSSVVLASLLTERRRAPEAMWLQDLASSRLLEYEVWNRIHARQFATALGGRTQELINLIQLVELTPAVLRRALQAFPVSARTLDSLHLATAEHLRALDQDVMLASFDQRMLAAARALNIPLYDL